MSNPSAPFGTYLHSHIAVYKNAGFLNLHMQAQGAPVVIAGLLAVGYAIEINGLIRLADGDYIQVGGTQANTNAVSVFPYSGTDETTLFIERVGD